MMETFNYKGKILTRGKSAIEGSCEGCFFSENNISCVPKDVPECKNGIFVELENA